MRLVKSTCFLQSRGAFTSCSVASLNMTDSPASLNAKRFAGKPMKQPLYHFSNVEKCQRDLSGSSIQLVEKREDFVDHMAELVLLCNAAMQRARKENDTSKKSSKPLSLEYIADRLVSLFMARQS